MYQASLFNVILLGLCFAAQIYAYERPTLDELTRKVFYDTEPKSLEQVHNELEELKLILVIENDPSNPTKQGALDEIRVLADAPNIRTDSSCTQRLGDLSAVREENRVYKNVFNYIEHYEKLQFVACSHLTLDRLLVKGGAVDESTNSMLSQLLAKYNERYDGKSELNPRFLSVEPLTDALVSFASSNFPKSQLNDHKTFWFAVDKKIVEPCYPITEQLKPLFGFYKQHKFHDSIPELTEVENYDWFNNYKLCNTLLSYRNDITWDAYNMMNPGNTDASMKSVEKPKVKKSCFSCMNRPKTRS